jgi:hypothetical protein
MMDEHATLQDTARKAQEATRRFEERTKETIGTTTRSAHQAAGIAGETSAAWVETSGKLFDELLQFSTTAAKENARVVSELQQVGIDGLRDMQNAVSRWQRLWPTALGDPLRWWQGTMDETVHVAERTAALAQRTAEVLNDSCRRVQGTAQQSGKALEETVRGATERMQDLYGHGARHH